MKNKFNDDEGGDCGESGDVADCEDYDDDDVHTWELGAKVDGELIFLMSSATTSKKLKMPPRKTEEGNWRRKNKIEMTAIRRLFPTPQNTHDCQWLEMFGFGDGQTCKKRDKQAILIFRGFLVRLEEKWWEEKKLPSLDQSVPPSSRHNDSRDETYIKDCKTRHQRFFPLVKPKSQSS